MEVVEPVLIRLDVLRIIKITMKGCGGLGSVELERCLCSERVWKGGIYSRCKGRWKGGCALLGLLEECDILSSRGTTTPATCLTHHLT